MFVISACVYNIKDKENNNGKENGRNRHSLRRRGQYGLNGVIGQMDKNYFVSLLRKNRMLKYQLYQHQLQYRKNEHELSKLTRSKKRKDSADDTQAFMLSSALSFSSETAKSRLNGLSNQHIHTVHRKLSHHLNLKTNKTINVVYILISLCPFYNWINNSILFI